MLDTFEEKHILVISGEPRILAEIKSELMDHYEISIAATSSAALAAMEMYKMSAIINYICEKREKAFLIFADIADLAKKKGIPVLFLAENNNDEDEIAAFAMGAVDYSVRRRTTAGALASRINLRIKASECEKRLTAQKAFLSGGNVPEVSLTNKTILIADDIELNRDIIAAMLSEINGLTLEFATDGKEAVEKFAKNPDLYSLIFMDVHMPVMNGLEAAKTIRHLDCENAREIPIIAVTADVEEKEIRLCLEAGMNDFIEKPMAYEKILAAAAIYCPTYSTGNNP